MGHGLNDKNGASSNGSETPPSDIGTAAPPVGNMNRHPPAIWFFFWGEFAERASFYGMRAILPLYLTTVLGYSDADGGERYYWFKMAAYFLPLLGGIVADRWLGRYWTIVGFSVPYVLGHFVLGIESSFWCMVALFALLAPGTGVIKPNISSLLGETYDQQRPGQDSLRVSGFQFFYFAINVGALISMFLVPIIRDKYGYATAFQFPAWLMVGALAIFALGKPFYAKEPADRGAKTPAERQEQNGILGLFGIIVSLLLWYVAFRYRDEAVQYVSQYAFDMASWAYWGFLAGFALAVVAAAVKVYSMFTPDMRTTLGRLFGVFGLIVLWWVAYEHNDSIWIFFARDYMHHAHSTFTVPAWLPAWLGGGTLYEPQADAYQYINSLFVLIFIPLFNGLFRSIDPGMKVFTSVRKILIGLLLTAVSSGVMMYAAYLTNGGIVKVTALWMVLAYIVLTAGEVLVYGTMLDLSYSAAPKSMKGFITACFLLTNTLGNFINSVITPNYGGSLNVAPEARGALSPVQFFAMSAGIVLVATVAFYFVGKRFEHAQREQAAAGLS